MKATILTKKRFQNLPSYELPSSIYNTEATLYTFRTKDKWVTVDKILKKFYIKNGPVFGNKLETINALIDNHDNINIPELILPESIAIVNHEVVGYIMPLVKSNNLYTMLSSYQVSSVDKISYLKQVGHILEKMESLRKHTGTSDFYLNDLHEHNFVVDDFNQVRAVDLDSCKINHNEVFPSRYLSEKSLASQTIKQGNHKYELTDCTRCHGYIKPDNETDIYCYIIMILNYLYGSNICNISINELYSFLDYLETIDIDYKLITALESIITKHPNINPYNLLDTLNDKNIGKSRAYRHIK